MDEIMTQAAEGVDWLPQINIQRVLWSFVVLDRCGEKRVADVCVPTETKQGDTLPFSFSSHKYT